ncbi:MAG: D-alanine--D-alanine ligase [Deltaproteobacteria bacterium]|nr:D-alanine--D-alanine ligase [Deltaproteobacteria bacterium]
MNREELKNKKIAVLLGGCSAEREISLKTGRAVLAALQEQGLSALALDADTALPERLVQEKVEVVFIALHGRYGEDGAIQGLLELLRIPYTGSGVLASSLAMDKWMAKKIFAFHGIPTPQGWIFQPGDNAAALRESLQGCYPLVVKPNQEGSTLGVAIIRKEGELEAAVEDALRYDSRVLIEKFISGKELTVSVFNGQALPVLEIRPKSGFYDFQAKYTSGQTEYLLPAPIDEKLSRDIQDLSVQAYNSLQCEGAARVDFMLEDATPYCLEINTVPGMTATSLLPKAAAHAGIPFAELVVRMLEGASLKTGQDYRSKN